MIELNIEHLKAAALAATPQNFDSAQYVRKPDEDGFVECPCCDGEGAVKLETDYCNYDGVAIGVQFYGIGPHFGAAESYYRAANPAAVLELIVEVERLRAAQGSAEPVVKKDKNGN